MCAWKKAKLQPRMTDSAPPVRAAWTPQGWSLFTEASEILTRACGVLNLAVDQEVLTAALVARHVFGNSSSLLPCDAFGVGTFHLPHAPTAPRSVRGFAVPFVYVS